MKKIEKNQCQQILDLVSSVPERAINLPEDLKNHAKKCAACQVELKASKRLISMLENAGSEFKLEIHPNELANRAIAGRKSETKPSLPFNKWWIIAPVATAALISFIFFGINNFFKEIDPVKEKLQTATNSKTPFKHLSPVKMTRIGLSGNQVVDKPSFNTIATKKGEKILLELSEGTRLWLNHQTKVSFVKDHPRSIVVEKGEVLLDVVRQGSLPPLEVKVPTGLIKVVGTKLQITARPDVTIVDVIRGKVITQSGGGSYPVTAGGEAILLKNQKPIIQAVSDLGLATEWASEKTAKNNGTSGFGKLKARKPGKKTHTDQALRLIDHSVKVKIQGRIVRTEIEEEFQNDTNTTMEGIYTFPLPADAKIAGLDLVVEGKWEHGAVVERKRGDKIWRGVIRNATPKSKRKPTVEYVWVPGPWKDPALLKWKQGSEFELKIFPIPKKGSRRIRISYTQILKSIPGGRRYILPLASSTNGKHQTERFRFQASIGGLSNSENLRISPYNMDIEDGKSLVKIKMDKGNFAPTGDIIIDIPNKKPGKEIYAYSYKNPTKPEDKSYALISIKPLLPFLASTEPLNIILAVDTSYSTQKTRLKRGAEFVELLLKELGPKHKITLMKCSSYCNVAGNRSQPATKTVITDLKEKIEKFRSLGSTRLGAVFESVKKLVKSDKLSVKNTRVIYIGDGIPTVGEMDAVKLGEKAKKSLNGIRMTTVSLGGQVDDLIMGKIAKATNGDFVKLTPGTRLQTVVYRTLQRQWGFPLKNIKLKLPEGLTEVAPEKLNILWPGQERMIAFRMSNNVAGDVVLSGDLGIKKFKRTYKIKLKPTTNSGNAFLPRVWAERKIDEMQKNEGEKAWEKIVAISKSHHVLSRYTSLIVLESPAMAKAFGVKDTRPQVEWSGNESTTEDETEAPKISTKKGRSLGFKSSSRSMPMRATRKTMEKDMISELFDEKSKKSPPRRMRRWRGRRRRILMKKVWYRVAKIRNHKEKSSYDFSRVQTAKLLLDKNPNSRDRTRDLIRAYMRSGDYIAAKKLATHWLSKDKLDAGALMALSGIASINGDVKTSIEYLASAIDVDPRNVIAHTRMFKLYKAKGEFKMMCAHALTRALVDPKNWKNQVSAARCTGDTSRHFALLKDNILKRAKKAVIKTERSSSLWERLIVEANWTGNQNLDIVVISPKGRIISWKGGSRRTKSSNVDSKSNEILAASMEERGKYQILIINNEKDLALGHIVKGNVTIKSYGSYRKFPFELSGKIHKLSDIRVTSKFRLERVR
jgi:Vault protein inter-alpha-trypsin domain/FecR protein/von Willebrand factor type A domain